MTVPVDAHTRLEAAVAEAKAECRAGRWEAGFWKYVDLSAQSLTDQTVVSRDATLLTWAQVSILESVAELAILLGHASAADHFLDGLSMAYRRAGNAFAGDCATLKKWHLAISQANRRRVEDALAELEPLVGSFEQISFTEDLTTWEAQCLWNRQIAAEGRHYFFAQFYREAGRLFLWIGQYSDAAAALKKGLRHTTHEAAARFKPALTLELAAAALEQGNLTDAENSLASLRSHIAPERQPSFVVRAWEIDAQARVLRGNFGGALSMLERVRDFCRKNGLLRAEAATSINIAQLLVILNQTVAATAHLTRARNTASHSKDEGMAARASQLLELAQIRRSSSRGGLLIAPPVTRFWRREQEDKAEDDDQSAWFGAVAHADSGSFLNRFDDYALAYQGLLSRRLIGRAEAWLAQMHEIFDATDSPLLLLRLRVLDAMQLYYQGKFESAEAAFAAARDELRARGLKHELWQVGRFAIWAERRLGYPPDAALARETNQLLDEISGTLDPRQQIFFQINKSTNEEERLGLWLDELIAEAKALAAKPWPQRLIARWRLWTGVYAFEQAAARARETFVRESLDLTGAKDARRTETTLWRRLIFHSWRTATVFFVVLPDRTAIIRTTFSSIAFGVSPVTRLQLREWLKAWHESLRQGEKGSQKALTFAEKVGEELQFSELLAALPRRVRALTVIPDDVLHGAPFAAIYNSNGFGANAAGQPQRFVANLYPVTVCSGSRLARRRTAASGKTELFAAGTGKAIGDFPALPYAQAEVAATSDWFRHRGIPVTCLLDHEATPAAVAQGLCTAAYAHLACHGVFDPTDINRTGLVLRGSVQEPAILSLRDLAQLDLRGLRHITLASCWSADNYILPGRWVLSLPQTLAAAGAESVLSSLWPVDDAIAAAFVRRFYEYARRLRRDSALRHTQLDCLQNTLFPHDDRNTADAFFWACFTLSGETGRL
jgi:CHAT domain-containing protein